MERALLGSGSARIAPLDGGQLRQLRLTTATGRSLAGQAPTTGLACLSYGQARPALRGDAACLG
ncbi:hypothetical protein GCM10023259_077770 [Thermocatellispora tengchongensis]